MAERKGSISGLTDEEAQEFHQYYIQGFVGFIGGCRGGAHPCVVLAALALRHC
jgi:uncharacterized protein YcsI (UPF0317 family)